MRASAANSETVGLSKSSSVLISPAKRRLSSLSTTVTISASLAGCHCSHAASPTAPRSSQSCMSGHWMWLMLGGGFTSRSLSTRIGWMLPPLRPLHSSPPGQRPGARRQARRLPGNCNPAKSITQRPNPRRMARLREAQVRGADRQHHARFGHGLDLIAATLDNQIMATRRRPQPPTPISVVRHLP